MSRRARGSWPGTAEEIADRDKVVALANRVGVHRLVFTVADLRAEISDVPALRLTHSSELSRHLAALDGDLIQEVGRRDFGQAGAEGYRGRKKYVLRSRLIELGTDSEATNLHDIDDLERAHLALWIAFLSGGSQPVHTLQITSILHEIDALALDRPTQTHSLLQALASRTPQVVEKISSPGERWARWSPIGEAPHHDHFDEWLATFHERCADGRLPTGKATLNEVGRDLLRLTIRASKSSRYAHGRCARLDDVRACAGENAEAGALAASIRRRKRSIAEVIIDAARGVIGGTARVDVRIARVLGPLSNNVFYDIPDEPGFEQRVAVIALQDVRTALSDGTLEAIEEDMREARALEDIYYDAGSELKALIAARGVLARREFERIEYVLHSVEKHMGAFSALVREEIIGHRAVLNRFLSRGIWFGDEDDVLAHTCDELGLNLETVLGASRPAVTPDEYASWFPDSDLRHLTPAEFTNLAVSLRRFVNPRYTHARDTNRECAYRYTIDRVEALPYAAMRQMASAATPLAAGARLLGRNFRSPELTTLLGSSPDPALRVDSIAALILLNGDPRPAADALLSDVSTLSDVVAEVVRLLHLVPGWNPAMLPPHVRSSRDWTVLAAIRDVVLARDQSRRIT